MFQIGDVVRVIPNNYMSLFKTFNYIDNWQTPNVATNECVMLGAKYEILDSELEDNGNAFYSLLKNGVNGRGWVFEKNLLSSENVSLCPFKVGDTVIFSLSDEEVKNQYFPIWSDAYSFNDKSTIYTITEILNDFYIFINFEKNNPYSAPFRWDNFKLVRAKRGKVKGDGGIKI